MRTTIRIDDELLALAKSRAAENRTTLNAMIEDALRASFSRQSERPTPIGRLPAMSGRGPRPGVRVNNNAELLDFMEGS